MAGISNGRAERGSVPRCVLLIGSAPEALGIRDWILPGDMRLACINNAYRIRSDWDYLVHAGDFPPERLPIQVTERQRVVTEPAYVPAMNAFGGIVYCGATMAYAAAYWVLHSLHPAVIAFAGCNMDYTQPGGQTHFYGAGTPDPLRDDITLRSLAAKSTRLFVMGLSRGVLIVNVTGSSKSRLNIPVVDHWQILDIAAIDINSVLKAARRSIDFETVEKAMRLEASVGYYAEGGDYWNPRYAFEEAKIQEIDALWSAVAPSVPCRLDLGWVT